MWSSKKMDTTLGIDTKSENIAHKPLVDSNQVILPPSYVNLSLMKNFVKAMNRNDNASNTLYSGLCANYIVEHDPK